MVHDERLRRALHEITLGGVGRDDVAHFVGHTARQGQRHSGERVSEAPAPVALPDGDRWSEDSDRLFNWGYLRRT